MSVVRELVARLGFQVDKSGFQEAEKALDHVRKTVRQTDTEVKRDSAGRLRDARGRYVGRGGGGAKGATAAAAGAKAAASGETALKTLGKLAATAGLTTLIESMVELGSRAEETQNVLSAVFGQDGAADVTEWAERTAVAVGRSKYALAEMAGQLGAVATPMLGNKERAREMSESFTQLAVDMGSFYNSTDEDALAALRSAMTGEVESIKRFGVVMNDATMQEYARTQGIHKKITAMTIAEKTELRYGYIMKTTAAAQGDAARTSTGYANSIKNVKAMLMDFGTDMGRSVLPKIEQMLLATRSGINAFKDFTKDTWLLEAAMWSLSAIAGVLAFDLVAPFIVPALAVGALILLVDDLYNLFNEGESAIGDFIDSMFGIGTTEDVVNSLRDAWAWLSETFTELQQTMPDLVGVFDMLLGVGDDLGFTIEYLVTKFLEFLDLVVSAPSKIANAVGRKAAEWLGFKVDQEDAEGRATGRGLGAGTMGFGQQLEARQTERGARIRTESDQRGVLSQHRREERGRQLRLRTINKDLVEAEDALGKQGLTAQERSDWEARATELRQDRAETTGEDPDQVTADRGARFGVARRRRAAGAAAPADAGMSFDPSLFPEQSVSAPQSAAPMSSAPSVVQQTNQTTINVNGGNLNEVRKVVQDTINANNRRAAAAIPRAGGA